MASRFRSPFKSYFNGKRKLLVGGTIDITKSGTSTTVPIFLDEDNKTKSKNPVPINGAGRTYPWIDGGDYRAILKDQDNEQIAYADPFIVQESSSDMLYSADRSYAINDRVKSTDNLWYVSLIDNNTGFLPQSNPVRWSSFLIIREWNAEETYQVTNTVVFSGFLYSSNTSNNTGITPGTTEDWKIHSKTGAARKSGTVRLTGGDESVTGLGFEPKFLKVWTPLSDPNGTTQVFGEGFGLPNLPDDHNSMLIGQNISVNSGGSYTPESVTSVSNVLFFYGLPPPARPEQSLTATLKSFDSDGFTINSLFTGVDTIDQVEMMWTAYSYGPGLVASS